MPPFPSHSNFIPASFRSHARAQLPSVVVARKRTQRFGTGGAGRVVPGRAEEIFLAALFGCAGDVSMARAALQCVVACAVATDAPSRRAAWVALHAAAIAAADIVKSAAAMGDATRENDVDAAPAAAEGGFPRRKVSNDLSGGRGAVPTALGDANGVMSPAVDDMTRDCVPDSTLPADTVELQSSTVSPGMLPALANPATPSSPPPVEAVAVRWVTLAIPAAGVPQAFTAAMPLLSRGIGGAGAGSLIPDPLPESTTTALLEVVVAAAAAFRSLALAHLSSQAGGGMAEVPPQPWSDESPARSARCRELMWTDVEVREVAVPADLRPPRFTARYAFSLGAE